MVPYIFLVNVSRSQSLNNEWSRAPAQLVLFMERVSCKLHNKAIVLPYE